MDVYPAKYLAAELQTLAEKCLIPIYKLPKFAVSLLIRQISRHDIYTFHRSINLMNEKKKPFKIYIINRSHSFSKTF